MSKEDQIDKTPGLVSWNELTTNDSEGSVAFYTSLFGWQREDVDMGGGTYTLFKIGERGVAGMYTFPPEVTDIPKKWIPYVTVENIDASVEKAVCLGAQVCKEVTALQIGKLAILRDPQGVIVGLWEFAK